MPSPSLNEEQAANQKKALQEMHAKRREKKAEGTLPKRSDTGLPKVSSTLLKKLKPLEDKAIKNISDSINGLDGVGKVSIDNSRWLLQQLIGLEKAILDAKAQNLKFKVELERAKNAGVPLESKTPAEKAQEFGKPRAVDLANAVTSYDPSWDEDDFVYENDEEDDS